MRPPCLVGAALWLLCSFPALAAGTQTDRRSESAETSRENKAEPAPAEAPSERKAEPAPAEAPSERKAEPAPAEAPSEDNAESLYHRAFEALAKTNVRAAQTELNTLIKRHPTDPLASRAKALLEILEQPHQAEAQKTGPRLFVDGKMTRDTPPTSLSRAEFIVFQTLHGIAVGSEICVIGQCDDERVWGGALLLGGGLGFTVSFLATQNGISPGHSEALNQGMLWGAWHGGALAGASQPSDAEVTAGLFLGGQLIGLGLGELAWRTTRASMGDISLASSTGFWAGALTLFIHAATEFEAKEKPIFLSILAASDAGLLAGALLADRFPMTRGRVLVIDGGGIIGSLLGMGVDLLIQGGSVEPAPLFTAASIGMVAGLGLTAFWTRNWNVPELPVSLALLPTEGGAILSLGLF